MYIFCLEQTYNEQAIRRLMDPIGGFREAVDIYNSLDQMQKNAALEVFFRHLENRTLQPEYNNHAFRREGDDPFRPLPAANDVWDFIDIYAVLSDADKARVNHSVLVFLQREDVSLEIFDQFYQFLTPEAKTAVLPTIERHLRAIHTETNNTLKNLLLEVTDDAQRAVLIPAVIDLINRSNITIGNLNALYKWLPEDRRGEVYDAMKMRLQSRDLLTNLEDAVDYHELFQMLDIGDKVQALPNMYIVLDIGIDQQAHNFSLSVLTEISEYLSPELINQYRRRIDAMLHPFQAPFQADGEDIERADINQEELVQNAQVYINEYNKLLADPESGPIIWRNLPVDKIDDEFNDAAERVDAWIDTKLKTVAHDSSEAFRLKNAQKSLKLLQGDDTVEHHITSTVESYANFAESNLPNTKQLFVLAYKILFEEKLKYAAQNWAVEHYKTALTESFEKEIIDFAMGNTDRLPQNVTHHDISMLKKIALREIDLNLLVEALFMFMRGHNVNFLDPSEVNAPACAQGAYLHVLNAVAQALGAHSLATALQNTVTVCQV